jgi:hypothetical protein
MKHGVLPVVPQAPWWDIVSASRAAEWREATRGAGAATEVLALAARFARQREPAFVVLCRTFIELLQRVLAVSR